MRRPGVTVTGNSKNRSLLSVSNFPFPSDTHRRGKHVLPLPKVVRSLTAGSAYCTNERVFSKGAIEVGKMEESYRYPLFCNSSRVSSEMFTRGSESDGAYSVTSWQMSSIPAISTSFSSKERNGSLECESGSDWRFHAFPSHLKDRGSVFFRQKIVSYHKERGPDSIGLKEAGKVLEPHGQFRKSYPPRRRQP